MLSPSSCLVAALLLAGCLHAPSPQHSPAPHSAGLFLAIPPAFAGCTTGITVVSHPPGMGPGTVPAAWESSPGVGSDVRVQLLDCRKVSWGPFERGPVQMVLEFHTKGGLPANCTFQRPDFIYNLERVLVSDAALARHIRQAHGLAADAAAISVTATRRDGGFSEQEWRWQVAGHPASWVRLAHSDTLLAGRATAGERWIWAHGGGLEILDVHRSYSAGVQAYAAAGEMHAPMLHPQAMPTGTYAGLGDAGIDYHATSRHFRFEDQRCERPTSS